MKLEKLKKLCAALCVVCASVAFGEFSSEAIPEKTYMNPLTLNVSSDMTLAEALAAAEATVGDLTGNVYDKVVKTGAGKVTVDTAIAAFAGDLFVEGGTWCITVNDGWGKASVPADNTSFIVIADGATLEMGGSVVFKGLDKTIYVSGKGVGETGAIRYTSEKSSDTTTCGPWGRNIVLLGDAAFVLDGGAKAQATIGRNRAAQQVTFYLNGHKLAYTGNDEATTSYAYWATGGTVEITAGIFTLSGSVNYSKFEGDASNEFILSGTAQLKAGTNICKPDTAWTLVVRTASPLTWTDEPTEGADPDYSFWPGAVRLETDTVLTGKNGASFSLRGNVTGDASLTWESETEGKTPHLYLDGEANDFAGGLAVVDAVVHAAASGSIPAAGGALALTNATIDLMAITHYALPALSVVGDCSVQPAAQEISTQPATPGLYEGYDDQIATKAGAGDTTTFYTTSVQLSTRWADSQTDLEKHDTEHYGRWTYSGYVWNNTTEPVVWVFSMSPRYYGYLRVADAWVNTNTKTGSEGSSLLVSSDKRGLIRATLQPGANRFEFVGMMVAKNDMKTGGLGLDTYDATTLGFSKTDALMVYRQDVTLDAAKDIAKKDGWEKLSDPGDGSVLTADLPSTPEPQTVTVPSLTFGADAALELAGWNLVTANMTGFGEIANATATDSASALAVNGVWTIEGLAVRNGGKLVTDRAVAFGPDATIALSGTKSPRGGVDYEILTAEGGITGLPTCEGAKLRLSDDGKSLIFCKDAKGLMLLFR